MRTWISICTLCIGFASPTLALGDELPGVWFLGDADRQRLVVGGSGQNPPEDSEQVCIGWSWNDPSPGVELYPDAIAGTFLESEATWSLTAGGETVAPKGCRPSDPPAEAANHSTAFPQLGLGPANELWLLAAPGESERRSGWADLLHSVEAAYRQSASSPLAEQTIGTLGRCRVRSLPIALDTALDRWSPVELATRASIDSEAPSNDDGHQLIRTRRFMWWVEPPTPGESCTASGAHGTLHLFPVPPGATDEDTTSAPEGVQHLLTIAGVAWQRLRYNALDADDWSPHWRRLLATPAANATSPPDLNLRPSPEQRQMLLRGQDLNLCEIEGLASLCARNTRTRRQLYTAVSISDAEIPWSEEHLIRTQEACQAVLTDVAADPNACTNPALWQRTIAGGLVADFSGEILLARQPAVRETWRDGAAIWRLDAGIDPATPMLDLRLLDGEVIQIATRDLLDAPGRPMAAWQSWSLGAGVLVALFALASALLARRRRPIPDVIDAPAQEELMKLIEDTVEARLRGAVDELDKRANAHTEQLKGVAQQLGEQLKRKSSTLGQELQSSLLQEAQSLSQSLNQSEATCGDVSSSPSQQLGHELDQLPDDERRQLVTAFEAAGKLGHWIDQLWPTLQTATECDLETIPGRLPEPAADEWRRAVQVLRTYARTDAVALRRLSQTSTDAQADSTLDAFLENVGLLASDRPLVERLKRYLEPFDHLGRLGEVTLALQYLTEAYPIEQLSKGQRSSWRRELTATHRNVGLGEDFHPLVSQITTGIGLRYRPIRYYKSRTDQSEYAFVRQQVSPISLSERVGFEATTDKTIIVRLERPFFFQLDTDIYYAGHAHVARG